MNADVFLDTNVLVYAATSAPNEQDKAQRALDLIRFEKFGTSAQVLQEFYVAAIRRVQSRITPMEAIRWIEQFAAFPCQPIDRELVQIAIGISGRYKISYWDAAILAAAMALGAMVVYSEDLNAGQNYASVRVINPFV